MFKIVGILLLFAFLLFAIWIMLKTIIEGNYIINKQIKKSGRKGSYYDIKRANKTKNRNNR